MYKQERGEEREGEERGGGEREREVVIVAILKLLMIIYDHREYDHDQEFMNSSSNGINTLLSD